MDDTVVSDIDRRGLRPDVDAHCPVGGNKRGTRIRIKGKEPQAAAPVVVEVFEVVLDAFIETAGPFMEQCLVALAQHRVATETARPLALQPQTRAINKTHEQPIVSSGLTPKFSCERSNRLRA